MDPYLTVTPDAQVTGAPPASPYGGGALAATVMIICLLFGGILTGLYFGGFLGAPRSASTEGSGSTQTTPEPTESTQPPTEPPTEPTTAEPATSVDSREKLRPVSRFVLSFSDGLSVPIYSFIFFSLVPLHAVLFGLHYNITVHVAYVQLFSLMVILTTFIMTVVVLDVFTNDPEEAQTLHIFLIFAIMCFCIADLFVALSLLTWVYDVFFVWGGSIVSSLEARAAVVAESSYVRKNAQSVTETLTKAERRLNLRNETFLEEIKKADKKNPKTFKKIGEWERKIAENEKKISQIGEALRKFKMNATRRLLFIRPRPETINRKLADIHERMTQLISESEAVLTAVTALEPKISGAS
jgi:hypothetical protein